MKKGFTLLEVLGSILILAGLITIVSQVTYGSFKRLEKGQRIKKVTMLLSQKMLELETRYKNKNIFQLPLEEEGKFEEETDYLWNYKVRNLELPSSLVFLSLQNLPQTDINIKVANLIREVLSRTIVELKLIITYKKAGKQARYSLVSYFINYPDVPSYIEDSLSKLLPSTGLEDILKGESK